MIYALDTNIISYFLKDEHKVYDKFNSVIVNGARVIIPPVVYYELKRGLLYSNATVQADVFDRLCSVLEVGDMDVKVWDEAARLYADNRRKGRTIEDADLFISAFCLVNGYTLVTNNTKHFEGINGLRVVNWVE